MNKLSQSLAQFRGRRARIIPMVLGAIVTLSLLAVEYLNPTSFERVGNLIFDNYQRAAPRKDLALPVKVVTIDQESLSKEGQWPWPRPKIAAMIDRLGELGASTVALDMVFVEADRTSPDEIIPLLREQGLPEEDLGRIAELSDHDLIMAESFKTTPVVGGFFLDNSRNGVKPPVRTGWGYSDVEPPLAAIKSFSGAEVSRSSLQKRMKGLGFVSVLRDKDGTVRTAPLLYRIDKKIYPSLSLEGLRVALRERSMKIKTSTGSGEFGTQGNASVVSLGLGDLEIPTTADGSLRLYYREKMEAMPAWQLFDPDADEAVLKDIYSGALVFVGVEAVGLRDNVTTPLENVFAGVKVHAQAAEQMLSQSYLLRPDWIYGVEILVLLVAGTLIAVSQNWLGSLKSGFLALGVLAGIAGLSWYLFRYQQTVFDPTFPFLGAMAVFTVTSVSDYYLTERERSQIKDAFNLYLSPEMVEQIADNPQALELGGEDRDLSILFCDVRDFSAISEKLGPQKLTQYLNAYLTPMTDILLESNATIDKYIGDAIVAFWNAPIEIKDHPRHAARGALKMLTTLDEMNNLHRSEPEIAPLAVETKIGIGLNWGECTVGNMGSKQRFAYSVLGDTVNLASRLEGLTKQYKVNILMGEAMARQLDDFAALELDTVQVVGRQAPERIYVLLGDQTYLERDDFKALQQGQIAFLKAYRAQDWQGAQKALGQAAHVGRRFQLDQYFEMMLGRIATLRTTNLPEDWDGIFRATEK